MPPAAEPAKGSQPVQSPSQSSSLDRDKQSVTIAQWVTAGSRSNGIDPQRNGSSAAGAEPCRVP